MTTSSPRFSRRSCRLGGPRPQPDPAKARKVAVGYYVVISLILGFPTLVSATYGSPMAYVFGFLFVVAAGWPLLFRRRR